MKLVHHPWLATVIKVFVVAAGLAILVSLSVANIQLILVYNRAPHSARRLAAGNAGRSTVLGVVAALVICYPPGAPRRAKNACTAGVDTGGMLGNVIDRLAYGHVID